MAQLVKNPSAMWEMLGVPEGLKELKSKHLRWKKGIKTSCVFDLL